MAISHKLRALGRTLSELQDEALEAHARPPTHERLAAIRRAHARRLSSRQRAPLRWALALGGLAAAALVILFLSRTEPLQFTVGPAQERGTLGVWVSAPSKEPSVISFSDGSRVRLTAGAQARVVATSEHGARVVIERGNVRVDVVPRPTNEWWVVGGPFEIHVTGTSFDARWEPDREELRVTMYEGHVDVRGACLPRARALSKGESASIACASPVSATPVHVAAPAPAASAFATGASASEQSAAPPVPAPARGAALTPSGGAPKAVPPRTGEAPGAQTASAPSWQASARRGEYKQALTSAEGDGFATLCSALSMSDLLELATTARLAGNLGRASEAYSAVRARFAASDGAATAAFHLGQIAFDGARSYSEARRWFEIYLGEKGSGALAAEALGRLMEAERALGDLAAARVTASRYLQRYPAGAHVRLARSLVEP